MSSDWNQRPEGGGRFAVWLIRGIALRFGRGVARLLLYPITAYFLLVRGPERRASRDYLARVLGRRPSVWHLARHLHCFSATILDRVFLLTGRDAQFQVQVHGLEIVHPLLDAGGGTLLLGSHLGSFEILRVLARRRPGLKLRVLLDHGQNRTLTQMLDALAPDIQATVIDAAQPGPALVLAVRDAAAEGALVGILADRARPGHAVHEHLFLGAPAAFPLAPMQMAAALGVPSVLAFGLYRGGRRYDLYFEPFGDGIAAPRAHRQAAALALQARFVARLEHYVRSAPYNWFNFYDFWNGHRHADRTPAAGLGGQRGAH